MEEASDTSSDTVGLTISLADASVFEMRHYRLGEVL
jgi:hypothetical protein